MKKTIRILLLFLVGAGAAASARAEATKELYKDAGLYGADGPMNVISWGNGFTIVEQTNQTTTPEGLKNFHANIATPGTGYGGFGFANVTQWGGSTIEARDFSDYSDGAIRFWLKSNTSLVVAIEYAFAGVPTQKSVEVTSSGGVWQEYVIPFTAFGSGINFAQMRVPFMIHEKDLGVQAWEVDHVRWTKPLSSIVVTPNTTFVSNGERREFTAEGRSSAGDLVVIYPTWSTTGSGSSIVPAAGLRNRAAILTAGSASGNVTATDGSVSANASFGIRDPIRLRYGLLSETISGAVLDTDSKLETSFGGTGASAPVLTTQADATAPEGTSDLSTVINQTGSDAYSGWFIQVGTLDNRDDIIRDMSDYFDGSLRFWFKGPASLQENLQVSIRSGNVAAGEELSKVPLKNYTTFDGQWHSVVVPLRDLAGAPPFADLSRTKVLFALFAVGAVSGSNQTFYVDNVRWDNRTPGALASISVSPSPVTLPINISRTFVATGLDAAGVDVDILPTWDFGGSSLGALVAAQGNSVRLNTAATPVSGTVRATVGGVSGSASVTVADLTFEQCFNIYSDAGAGADIGVSTGGATGTVLTLVEPASGGAEGNFYLRSTYTLRNSPGKQDAYAVWYAQERNQSRFMQAYATDGYLHFWVRTTQDLQVSIRSANIDPNQNGAQFMLSELGVPLNGSWQEVWVALADFKARNDAIAGQPPLDFTQIKDFFTIAALSNKIGEQTNQVFDVDDVRWCTTSPLAPDPQKVYTGLIEKQHASGLVQSFANDFQSRAVTYDQALAAMSFIYKGDVARARSIFDVYLAKYNAGGFAGFNNEYNVDTPSTVLDYDRDAGPNAFMGFALLHYLEATGDTKYDAMTTGIVSWIRSLEDSDGGIKFGFTGQAGTPATNKSTEHNFDSYALFRDYALIRGDASYEADAARVYSWLTTKVYDGTRFSVGENADGTVNPDRALDCYSWAPLALSTFTSVINLAEGDFGNTKTNLTTSIAVTGFDFSGPPQNPVDKDAVWIEGTAQMVVAYLYAGNTDKAAFYNNELDKAVFQTGPDSQALAYATNAGTAYGFTMDPTHAAISSMAWYLFAKWNFNPLHPVPVFMARIKSIASNAVAPEITWTVNTMPAGWVRADDYIEFESQPISEGTQVVQIFTDNTNRAYSPPYFADPTPAVTSNPDSDPSGLLRVLSSGTTTFERLDLAWSVKLSSFSAPPASNPNPKFATNPNDAYQWNYMKDHATPSIDLNGDGQINANDDILAFQNGDASVTVRRGVNLHFSQGDGAGSFFPGPAVNHLYLEGNFSSAAAQTPYRTRIFLQAYSQ